MEQKLVGRNQELKFLNEYLGGVGAMWIHSSL